MTALKIQNNKYKVSAQCMAHGNHADTALLEIHRVHLCTTYHMNTAGSVVNDRMMISNLSGLTSNVKDKT